jgi:hypothetical protein
MSFLLTIQSMSLKVEPPIIEHILITKHFPIFSSFLNPTEQFLYHWTRKLECYKCSWSVRSKGAMQKTQEEKN